MKRESAETVLQRYFETRESAEPVQSEIESVLDRVWHQLELHAGEFVGEAQMPAARAPSHRFVWTAGIVATAVAVNLVVWNERPPFAVVDKSAESGPFTSIESRRQAGEALRVAVPEDAFEVASVKLVAPSSDAAQRAKTSEQMNAALTGCTEGYPGNIQVDPGRLIIPVASVVSLVIAAYDQDCTLVEGGPAWARSGEYYEINAILPPGTPSYTAQDLHDGKAPRLQGMLQNLLAERFQLVVKRELREMPVYALTVSTRRKLVLSPDETRSVGTPGFQLQVARGKLAGMAGPAEAGLFGHAISAAVLAKRLRHYAGRVVVDRTGLTDLFDCDLQFSWDGTRWLTQLPGAPSPVQPASSTIPPPPAPALPSLGTVLEEQLGFKLEATRMPIEVLVIERVNRPSEN
jgi:uncharacterized protein (TIGR03435 family)